MDDRCFFRYIKTLWEPTTLIFRGYIRYNYYNPYFQGSKPPFFKRFGVSRHVLLYTHHLISWKQPSWKDFKHFQPCSFIWGCVAGAKNLRNPFCLEDSCQLRRPKKQLPMDEGFTSWWVTNSHGGKSTFHHLSITKCELVDTNIPKTMHAIRQICYF